MKRWDLKGKRVLVTGGTKGIGRAIAEEFLGLGAEVMIAARNGQEVEALVRLWQAEGHLVTGLAADVTKGQDRERVRAAIDERWGALDVLVNNAGTNLRRKLADYTDEEMRLVMEVNLFSAVEFCRLCLHHLKLGVGPSVVNISSVSGVVDTQSGAPYGMSKAALIQLSRNLAVEWAEYGIRVNTVSPWYTDTPLASPVLRQPDRLEKIIARTPLGKVALSEEVAAAVAFLAMDKAAYITGVNLPIDGGMLAKGL